MNKAAENYDSEFVLDQLKYLGMCEIIRIRKHGYPIHMPFAEFLQRYRCLVLKQKVPADQLEAIRSLFYSFPFALEGFSFLIFKVVIF